MTGDDRVFGEPDAEHMVSDPADVFERWLDINDDGRHKRPGWSLTIEEWTVEPTSMWMPNADQLLETICDRWFDEMSAELFESVERLSHDPAIVDAFRSALDLFSATVDAKGWRIADSLVAEHTVTWADGLFHVDGAPTDWRIDGGGTQ